MNRYRPWATFLLLSSIWGSSFLFIKVAVQEIGPLLLVGFRLFFGLLLLLPLVLVQRKRLPRDPRTWGDLVFIAVVGVAVPFTLISWGSERIDSGLTAILNGTAPLFSILVADLWLRDNPVTAGKVAGLLAGFAGVVTLMSGNLGSGSSGVRIQAVVVASACYAISNAYVRKRLMHLEPLTVAVGQLLIAEVVVWTAAGLSGNLSTLSAPGLFRAFTGRSLFAVAWLGVMGTGVAFPLYFALIRTWGATRAILVTYLVPVIAVLLGVLVLGEQLSWRLLVGGGLVMSSIGLVNWRGGGEADDG